ncbi:hypothetical protein [Sphaerisporangium sp. TRM90804]|uniref:hypothetical protein n=1 Tax=Sphaerisporangium sp. TRM90804 TaxID=3031113 RepID=UPI0024468B2A|nr:hypothetical protein [Sphaerisporangium sp. TRM90804]MDH2430738.1 hypothetical protein [Sphaerisporangium sp. TRM90804]
MRYIRRTGRAARIVSMLAAIATAAVMLAMPGTANAASSCSAYTTMGTTGIQVGVCIYGDANGWYKSTLYVKNTKNVTMTIDSIQTGVFLLGAATVKHNFQIAAGKENITDSGYIIDHLLDDHFGYGDIKINGAWYTRQWSPAID